MTGDRINILADKWLKRTISAAEKRELESWYASYESLEQQVNSDLDEEAFGNMLYDVIASRAGIEPALIPDNAKRVTIRTKLWPRIAVAAAVAVMTLGVWLYYASSINGRHPEAGQGPGRTQYANDIAPGKNGATITLGNGKVIALSDAKSGVVVGGGSIKYNDGSFLSPSGRDGVAREGSGSNNPLSPQGGSLPEGERSVALTASTAKGQTYQFTLPDGTKVWLNAASTIRFPSQFSGKERKILLDGEGYFEVAKDKAHPFIVATDKQEVEVLGTHFNINAYKDEGSIKTTLLEGSVRVSSLRGGTTRQSHDEVAASRNAPRNDEGDKQGDVVLLRPNQQSVLTGSNRIGVKEIDVDEVVAWKAGDFIFTKVSLADIMKSIGRWYDVEVSYDPGVDADQTFSVLVSRNKNISQILLSLEKTGKVKFKIEGKKVRVSK